MRSILVSILLSFGLSASANADIMGFSVKGNFVHEVVAENTQSYIENGQEPGKRYQLVMIGCGTECASYGAVIDFQEKTIYALDEWVDAVYSEPEMTFEFTALVSEGKQYIFTDMGVITVKNNDRADGRFLSSVLSVANEYAKSATQNDKYLPINVGCGTECYALLGALDVTNKQLVVIMDQDQYIGVYEAEKNPMAIKIDGKNFIYDGKSLKEFSFN